MEFRLIVHRSPIAAEHLRSDYCSTTIQKRLPVGVMHKRPARDMSRGYNSPNQGRYQFRDFKVERSGDSDVRNMVVLQPPALQMMP